MSTLAQEAAIHPAHFPFASRWVRIADSQVHYVDEGSGPVLLFVHAAPAWSFMWRKFIRALRADFRCIALDLPGFGLSQPLPIDALTLERMTATVVDLVRALDLADVTFVVHDTGGPVGLAAAVRLADRCRAVVVTDSCGFSLADYPAAMRVLRVITGRLFTWANRRFNLLPRIVSRFGSRRGRQSATERDVFLGPFADREARSRVTRLMRELVDRQPELAALERGLIEQLAHVPALLIYGEHDPARRMGWQTRFESIFPRHRSVVIPGEGHFPHEGAPEEMIEAIRRWWAEQVDATPAETR